MTAVSPQEWLWRRWRLGEGEFRGLDPSNPAVRPASLPPKIPQEWWPRLQAFVARRPQVPAPVPAPPRHALERRVLYAAWGLANGSDPPARLIEKARGRPYFGAICAQDTPDTRPKLGELRSRCLDAGLAFGIWQWATSFDETARSIEATEPGFHVSNVEHNGDWETYCIRFAAAYPQLDRALWTNFVGTGATPEGVYDRRQASPWIECGFELVTEAYTCQLPTLTPARLDWTAKTQLGWTRTFPTIGIYTGGWTIEAYLQPLGASPALLDGFPYWGPYLAEYMP